MTVTPKSEPAITTATISALAAAVIALLVAFAVPISEQQQVAILGVVAVVAPVVVGFVTRTQVVPNASVVERVESDGVTVVAGEANEIETDEEIRELGGYEPKRAVTPEDPDLT